jgi:poly(hydroxyalkanoate) granule-associated protein
MTTKKSTTKRSTRSSATRTATTAAPQELSRKLWLAGLGAASMVRQRGETIVADVSGRAEAVKDAGLKLVEPVLDTVKVRAEAVKDAGMKLVEPVLDTVKDRVEGVSNRVQETFSTQIEWATEQAESRVGQVLGKLGIPSRAEVKDLSRRVNELQKQVKAIKSARAAA